MSLFHRYKSEIHGDYRRAYLRCGLLTGALLALYVLVRLLMGKPVESPVSLVTDAILLVAVLLFMAYYRNALPDKKITLKEAMLFGMGLAVVAAVVYGIALWCICMSSKEQVLLFQQVAEPSAGNAVEVPQHYWATWYSLSAAVVMMLVGGFGAFVGAIFFRNEKSEVVHRAKQSKDSKPNEDNEQQ